MARRYRRRFKRRRKGKHKKLSIRNMPQYAPDIGISKIRALCYSPLPSLGAMNSDCIFNINTGVPQGGANYVGFFPIVFMNPWLRRSPNLTNIASILDNSTGSLLAGGDYGCAIVGTEPYADRFYRYRIMGIKIVATVRTPDISASVPNAAPLQVFGFPFQRDSTALSNYFSGDGTSMTPTLTVGNMRNLKYAFSRKIKGFGSNSQTTYSTYWSLPKIYGMTKDQWKAASGATGTIDAVGPSHSPFFCIAAMDYNASNVRQYALDLKLTYYVRWEGASITFK